MMSACGCVSLASVLLLCSSVMQMQLLFVLLVIQTSTLPIRVPDENNSNSMLYGGEVEDVYLDLVEYSDQYSINHQQQYSVPQKKMKYEGDGVVPGKGKNGSFQLPLVTVFPFPPFDVESTITDASFTYSKPQMPPQLTPMDREARVLRYREKKKSRKFEKTIRYASRKAYAETPGQGHKDN